MRVVVSTEARLLRTPDGRVWTPMGPGRAFWERYLVAFDRVRVVARLLDAPNRPPSGSRVDSGMVEVWPVPHYVGLGGYLRRQAAIRRTVRAAAAPSDAVIIRAPSPIGSLLAAARDAERRPYALEVVGDPYGVFAPGAVGHPLRPLIRALAVADLRRRCARAVGVAYVTQHALQRRYPAGLHATTASFSSIELGPEAFVARPRAVPFGGPGSAGRVANLVSVGSLEQVYKGIDTLIEAVARLTAEGKPVRLVHVGDGRFRPELERLATRLGVADRVQFAGAVPAGDAVRSKLDTADLMVMPSRTEGLPRALIEAMARGLPAIGSTAGGISELLPAEDLVAPDRPAALAAAIGELVADPGRMAAASARNLERARDFAAEVLGPQRAAWYRAVRGASTTTTRVSNATGTLDRAGAETVVLDQCEARPRPAAITRTERRGETA